MTIEQYMKDANKAYEEDVYRKRAIDAVERILRNVGNSEIFSVKFKESYVGFESGDDLLSFSADITFTFGNVTRNHTLMLGWNEDDGVGIEVGEDCDLVDIDTGTLFKALYFDLAFEGLEDKYLA